MSADVVVPSVVARVVGGLGNQLFIYATARRLAGANDAALILDANFFRSDRLYHREYRLDRFVIGPHRLRRSTTWLPAIIDRRRWRIERIAGLMGLLPGVTAIVERVPNQFQPEVLQARVTGPTLLDGYWQDERYFADIRDVLGKELEPVIDPGRRNRELAVELQAADWIGIHCRREHAVLADGRVISTRGRPALPAGYYLRALEALAAGGRMARAVLFGDQPQWLLEHLPVSLKAVVVDWNSGPGQEVNDLWLMCQCRRMVVSNSTLAWWAGWLGRTPGREVVAPQPQDLEYWVRSADGWTEMAW